MRVTEPFDSAADLKDAPYAGTRLRPKDAATLILVRRDGPEPRLLMGRRASGHVFMASKWVFPGGRIARSDYRAPAATELKPETQALVDRGLKSPRARGLGMAAIRETFEETGLLLARPSPPRPALGVWRQFLERGVAPDLAALDLVARAITPPGRTRRFDARFFMADAEALTALEPDSGDRELDEIAWLSIADMRDLDLPQITRFVVGEVADRLANGRRPLPLVRMVRGKHSIERLES
ncbi:MAG: NUDIX domain-containing protein [Proteobacteria bacterium]|nr:NUDIX domain-containing protein [Pseudomonadota bacterium]